MYVIIVHTYLILNVLEIENCCFIYLNNNLYYSYLLTTFVDYLLITKKKNYNNITSQKYPCISALFGLIFMVILWFLLCINSIYFCNEEGRSCYFLENSIYSDNRKYIFLFLTCFVEESCFFLCFLKALKIKKCSTKNLYC